MAMKLHATLRDVLISLGDKVGGALIGLMTGLVSTGNWVIAGTGDGVANVTTVEGQSCFTGFGGAGFQNTGTAWNSAGANTISMPRAWLWMREKVDGVYTGREFVFQRGTSISTQGYSNVSFYFTVTGFTGTPTFNSPPSGGTFQLLFGTAMNGSGGSILANLTVIAGLTNVTATYQARYSIWVDDGVSVGDVSPFMLAVWYPNDSATPVGTKAFGMIYLGMRDNDQVAVADPHPFVVGVGTWLQLYGGSNSGTGSNGTLAFYNGPTGWITQTSGSTDNVWSFTPAGAAIQAHGGVVGTGGGGFFPREGTQSGAEVANADGNFSMWPIHVWTVDVSLNRTHKGIVDNLDLIYPRSLADLLPTSIWSDVDHGGSQYARCVLGPVVAPGDIGFFHTNGSGSAVNRNDFIEVQPSSALGDLVPPVVSAGSPGASAIATTQAIEFDATDDTGTLAQVIVSIDYSSPNRHDLAFRGLASAAGYDEDFDGASTVTAITDGYRYSVVPDGGWRGPFTMHKTAIDLGGNATTESTAYTMLVAHSPTISNISPVALSTIDPDDTVSFRHTDPTGLLTERIYVDFPSGARELVWDGDEFSDRYATSARTVIIAGRTFDYDVTRAPGWPDDPTFVTQLIDVDGIEFEYSWSYGITGDSDPQVLNVSPTAGTIIDTNTPILFRTYDLTGLLIEFVYAEIRGVQELVWDGSNFTLNYANSIRTVVSVDRTFDYEVIRSPGWTVPPRFTVKLIDVDGNQAAPSWSYMLAEVQPPSFGANVEPTSIEFSTADIYDALFQSVGDGIQAEPGSIVEAWREAKAAGLQVATRDARAALQAFPNRATDFLAMYEDLLGIQPAADATIEERQAAAALRYTQLVDATGPSVQAMLTAVDPDLELFEVPYEHTVTTEMGVRAFEDWDPDAAGASGPAYNLITGKTHTIVPNYSSLFKVYVLLNAVGAVTETQKRALMTAGGVLSDALPAWVDFTIFRTGGFTLDTDLLDLTVFADGLTVP